MANQKVMFAVLLFITCAFALPQDNINGTTAKKNETTSSSVVGKAIDESLQSAPRLMEDQVRSDTNTTTEKPVTQPTKPTSNPNTTTTTNRTTSSTTAPTTPTSTLSPTPSTTPSTTPLPTPDKHDRSFDLPSFIGGIILSLGLTAIGYVVFKFYKSRTDPNYRTL